MIDKTYQFQPYICDEKLIFFILKWEGEREKDRREKYVEILVDAKKQFRQRY